MRIVRLQLFDYRNFHRLDIALSGRPGVFVGDNAQGKSNLLEAVYLMATMSGRHAETDVQLIRRECLEDVQPAARVAAEVMTQGGAVRLEVAVVARPGARGLIGTKTVRVNGVPKRLGDAVGTVTAVIFTADDLDLVVGQPSLRRHFLDTMLSQVDRGYAAARHRYERVLTQRNHLLKRIREGLAREEEMTFWDGELCKDGGTLVFQRAEALAQLQTLAKEIHASLVPGEELEATYHPRLEGAAMAVPGCSAAQAGEVLAASLRQGLARDVAAGMTLQGPHRDDVQINLNGLGAAGYASRAQQRTIALSLRLAETRFLTEQRGEAPVLLLDDILSEMDGRRRESVLRALPDGVQMLITGADWDRFPREFLSASDAYAVGDGTVAPLMPETVAGRTAGL